jgi:hypothetical protein
MPPPESQIPQATMRIETELPVWPTEKSRQNGVHLHYWRMLSSSIPIEDLAKLPGNTKTLGLISRKLLIIRIDGGEEEFEPPVPFWAQWWPMPLIFNR